MKETDTNPALKAACVLAIGCAIAVFAFKALNDRLWSDELLTTNLLAAGSLPKLWAGIALGIDGNPPFYLTAAWLLVASLPKAIPAATMLKLVNLGLTVAAVIALCRVARRFASAGACWIGALLFAALNDNAILVAFELRTYALYFLMAALAVLFQQRTIERPSVLSTSVLALIYVGLTLAHTFGIAYVGCIAVAGWLSQRQGRKPGIRSALIAVAPSIIVIAAWSPFLREQLEVAKPYGWMERPGLAELLETLFASQAAMWVTTLELWCLAIAMTLDLRKGRQIPSLVQDPRWQPHRYVILVAIGMTGLVLTSWVIASAFFPLFVPRFFTPQLVVSCAINIAFGEWLLRFGRRRRAGAIAIGVLIAPLAFTNVAMKLENSAHGTPLCADGRGDYFETAFVSQDVPVIAESPHIFLPRMTYADHGLAYRFPLDWEVVLKYPEYPRGNAVDFHIMQNLQTWAPMPSVMSTDDIVRTYPMFLVIEQSGRAWFKHLRATRNVAAQKLADVPTVAGAPSSCTLWKVTHVSDKQ